MSDDHCCIGFRRRRSSSSSSNGALLGHQKKCFLVKQHDTLKLTTAELELVTRSQLSKNNDKDNDTVQFYNNDDALLLKCRPIFLDNDMQTIFGIVEAVISATPSSSSLKRDSIQTHISWVEPIVADYDDDNELNQDSCSCVHPRGCWKRQQGSSNSNLHQHTATLSSDHCEGNFLKIIDLTKLQDMRRNDDVAAGYHHPSFDSAAKIFHLLRSTLNCTFDDQLYELHSASPWKTNYDKSVDGSSSIENANDARSQIEASEDQVVALLIKSPSIQSTNNSTWYDELERQEYRELVDFRVGDAAPSYYLHSSIQLSSRNRFFEALHHHHRNSSSSRREECCSDGSNCLESGVSLFVYRKLSPRDMLNSPCHEGAVDCPGCLTETYLEEAVDDSANCELQLPVEPVLRYRMVSPPYLMHDREYPGLLDPIRQRLDDIRREAKLIPHWTAWPERNHYSSSGENGGASWTVFPLCYTFPANDITQRKFIDKTCAFVPVTTALLEGLGPLLRTALFSRLDPKTKLGTHTGWSDLANHVLRVHIPLIVPRGDVCGTWVDGCVETQDVGRIICFDDSKVHRAFNYSESEERIVLIIDLKRPSNLPKGTAVGGHTDELDGFIQELSTN